MKFLQALFFVCFATLSIDAMNISFIASVKQTQQVDGKIIDHSLKKDTLTQRWYTLIARYNADFTLDTTFGNNGYEEHISENYDVNQLIYKKSYEKLFFRCKG